MNSLPDEFLPFSEREHDKACPIWKMALEIAKRVGTGTKMLISLDWSNEGKAFVSARTKERFCIKIVESSGNTCCGNCVNGFEDELWAHHGC